MHRSLLPVLAHALAVLCLPACSYRESKYPLAGRSSPTSSPAHGLVLLYVTKSVCDQPASFLASCSCVPLLVAHFPTLRDYRFLRSRRQFSTPPKSRTLGFSNKRTAVEVTCGSLHCAARPVVSALHLHPILRNFASMVGGLGHTVSRGTPSRHEPVLLPAPVPLRPYCSCSSDLSPGGPCAPALLFDLSRPGTTPRSLL